MPAAPDGANPPSNPEFGQQQTVPPHAQGQPAYGTQPYPPQQFPPPAEVTKPKKKLWPIVLGVIGAVLLLGVLAIYLLVRPISAKNKIYEPHGDGSWWLDAGYSSGQVNELDVDWKILGASSDRTTLLGGRINPTGPSTTAGIDIKTGEVVWTNERTACLWDFQVHDGKAVCSKPDAGNVDTFQLVVVDIATGVETVLYAGPGRIPYPETVAVQDGSYVIKYNITDGVVLVSLPGDGTVAWNTKVPSEVDCIQIDGRIGCSNRDGLTVVNAATGAVEMPFTPFEGKESTVYWATDGYITAPGAMLKESVARVFDYTGKQLGTTKKISEPSFPSSEYDGAVYTLEALQQGGNALLVDGKGTVVQEITEGGSRKRLMQPSGNQAANDTYVPLAGSADGTVLLGSSNATQTLRTRDGADLFTIQADRADVSVVDGLVVVRSGFMDGFSKVYLPAG